MRFRTTVCRVGFHAYAHSPERWYLDMMILIWRRLGRDAQEAARAESNGRSAPTRSKTLAILGDSVRLPNGAHYCS